MKLQNLVERLRNFKNDFGKIGSVAGLTTVLPSVGSMILLTFVYQFGPWLQANKEIGVMIFVSLMTFFSGLALVATNILGIVSGFAFNFQVGMLAQLAGLLGASTLMFILAKRYASENLQTKIEEKPKLQAFHSALLKENWLKTLLILILVRLSPAMPFAVTNFIISAAGISFKTFILGTVLGMLPRTFALVMVGSSLSELNLSEPQEAWVLVLGIIATILAITVISLVGKRALNRLTAEQNV
jgi:uncharacterized membrane protein YdjX (TVP38/TMEM64 family)